MSGVADAVRALVLEAVAETMATVDRPCFALSGGLDSSTVVCCAKLLGYRTDTFTGYYIEPGFSELHHAEQANVLTFPVWIEPANFLSLFDEFARAMQEPYQGVGAFGQYVVARRIAASDAYDTVVSGEGADELFGGYARLYPLARELKPAGYENLILPDGYPSTLEEALAWEMRHLDDLLACDGQVLAACGLQGAAPFTYPPLVDYVLGLPAHMRVAKDLLRKAMEGIVPDAILARRDKMGFPAPFVYWAHGPLRDFVMERIGYLPSLREPYARGWFHDLIRACK